MGDQVISMHSYTVIYISLINSLDKILKYNIHTVTRDTNGKQYDYTEVTYRGLLTHPRQTCMATGQSNTGGRADE